jgi:hypothetical protein
MLTEQLSCTRQSRHHGPDWNVQRVCDLLVLHLLQIREDDDFLKCGRQQGDRLPHQLAVGAAEQGQFRCVGVHDQIVETVLALLYRVAPFEPAAAGQKRVAQDPEHPRAKIAALPEARESLQSLRKGFLNEILRFVCVSAHPPCEVVKRTHEGQRQCLEIPLVQTAHRRFAFMPYSPPGTQVTHLSITPRPARNVPARTSSTVISPR